MIKKKFFKINGKVWCFVPRSASTSIALSIDNFRKGKTIDFEDRTISHMMSPQNRITDLMCYEENSKARCIFGNLEIIKRDFETVAAFREPIDRFLSGCAREGWDVTQGILELQKEEINLHIRSQHTFILPETKLFRHSDQLNDLLVYIGVTTELKHMNKSDIKPTATEEQIIILREFYEKDYVIYDAIV